MEPTHGDDRLVFRSWLLDRLREMEWSQGELARRLNTYRSTVNKWLQPPDSPQWRRPSYDACLALARVFGASSRRVLEMAGHDPGAAETSALTPRQLDALGLIRTLPDDMLIPLLPQLRALSFRNVQETMRRDLAELYNGTPPAPEPTVSERLDLSRAYGRKFGGSDPNE